MVGDLLFASIPPGEESKAMTSVMKSQYPKKDGHCHGRQQARPGRRGGRDDGRDCGVPFFFATVHMSHEPQPSLSLVVLKNELEAQLCIQ